MSSFSSFDKDHLANICKFQRLCGAMRCKFSTNHVQIWHFYKFRVIVFSHIDGVLLSGPSQKLQKPWKGKSVLWLVGHSTNRVPFRSMFCVTIRHILLRPFYRSDIHCC